MAYARTAVASSSGVPSAWPACSQSIRRRPRGWSGQNAHGPAMIASRPCCAPGRRWPVPPHLYRRGDSPSATPHFQDLGLTPAKLRAEFLGDRLPAMEVILDRAVARGEVDPARLSPRGVAVPFDLFRHEAFMTLDQVADRVLTEIVDEVFLPLIGARGPGRDSTRGRAVRLTTDTSPSEGAPVMISPGTCCAALAMSARRHSRRAPVAGLPVRRASPPCSRWRRDTHHGGSRRFTATPACVTDGSSQPDIWRAISPPRRPRKACWPDTSETQAPRSDRTTVVLISADR